MQNFEKKKKVWRYGEIRYRSTKFGINLLDGF